MKKPPKGEDRAGKPTTSASSSRPKAKKTSATKGLHVSVKKKAGRTESSRRWLERQMNDPYVFAAKEKGYRSRAAFKFLELQEKYRLIKPGYVVLDLGAAPGGWTQIAVEVMNLSPDSPPSAGQVVGIDILPMEPIPGATLLELDFLSVTAEEKVRSILQKSPDLIMSDMAANTTGHRATDHLRTMALVEAAADTAMRWLAPGGSFLAKIFQGGTQPELLSQLKKSFQVVRHIKPKASRAESVEMYVLATGFRGASSMSNSAEKN